MEQLKKNIINIGWGVTKYAAPHRLYYNDFINDL